MARASSVFVEPRGICVHHLISTRWVSSNQQFIYCIEFLVPEQHSVQTRTVILVTYHRSCRRQMTYILKVAISTLVRHCFISSFLQKIIILFTVQVFEFFIFVTPKCLITVKLMFLTNEEQTFLTSLINIRSTILHNLLSMKQRIDDEKIE